MGQGKDGGQVSSLTVPGRRRSASGAQETHDPLALRVTADHILRMRIALSVLALLLVSAAPAGQPIVVTVSGITASQGRVHVDICTPSSFTRESCPFSAKANAREGATVVTVPNVPPGRYAAQAYYDANGNGKADRNMLGMPLELVGFSNDVKVKLSRPKFEASAFKHGGAPTQIAFAVRKIP